MLKSKNNEKTVIKNEFNRWLLSLGNLYDGCRVQKISLWDAAFKSCLHARLFGREKYWIRKQIWGESTPSSASPQKSDCFGAVATWSFSLIVCWHPLLMQLLLWAEVAKVSLKKECCYLKPLLERCEKFRNMSLIRSFLLVFSMH